eukprot:8245395-Lingulodinium_polyedra.AAC.1
MCQLWRGLRSPTARLLPPLRHASGDHGLACHLPSVGRRTFGGATLCYGPPPQYSDVHPRTTSPTACRAITAGQIT